MMALLLSLVTRKKLRNRDHLSLSLVDGGTLKTGGSPPVLTPCGEGHGCKVSLLLLCKGNSTWNVLVFLFLCVWFCFGGEEHISIISWP